MAQPTLQCKGHGGRCLVRLGLIGENGDLVLRAKHHSEWHETRVPLEELLQRAIDGGCLNDGQRRRLIELLTPVAV